MPFESENFVIRKARMEDYDAVTKIGDVKGGKDYMASLYNSFLKDSDVYPLVAEVNKQVVGFYMSHILDGGTTVMKRAGRVHPSYRGRGIFHALGDALDAHTRASCPAVQYEVFATNESADRASGEFQENGFVEILRKRIQNLIFNTKEFRGIDRPGDVRYVAELTVSDVRRLFASKDAVMKLFPEKRLFNFFVGYRALDANIPLLVNDVAKMYATFRVTTKHQSDWRSPASERGSMCHPEEIDIVSCGYHHQSERGVVYVLDIYALDEHQPSSLQAHLKKHLNCMRQLTNGEGVLMLTFGSTVDEIEILASLKDLGIWEDFPFDEKFKVLYERRV